MPTAASAAAGPRDAGMEPEEETEEQKPGAPAKVRTPTAIEREDHYNSGHAVYRSWCEHCVAAKGQGTPHVIRAGNPSDLPEISFDYFYLGDRQSTGLPNIAVKYRETQSLGGTTMENKGRNNSATSYLIGWTRGLGSKRAIARSDNTGIAQGRVSRDARYRTDSESVPPREIIRATVSQK